MSTVRACTGRYVNRRKPEFSPAEKKSTAIHPCRLDAASTLGKDGRIAIGKAQKNNHAQ
jgi:hypothetical protein